MVFDMILRKGVEEQDFGFIIIQFLLEKTIEPLSNLQHFLKEDKNIEVSCDKVFSFHHACS